MKGVLVILDGLGDLPCQQLDGKTPLEAASKPNLNWLAGNGESGYMYTIDEKFAPESDTAVVSILGNNPFISSRGVFESLGAGVFHEGDLALRTNFATYSKQHKRILDRRAGRTLTTEEARILASAINSQIDLGCEFIFKPTVQHRGVLVLKGGFSENITNTDPAYQNKGKYELRDELKDSEPLDEEENTEYSAKIVNDFVRNSNKILEEHPVNTERKKKGLLPANIILTRDAGTAIPQLRKMKNWAAVAYMPLEIGISKSANMKIYSFQYPELKDDVYGNLYDGLKKAVKFSLQTLEKEKDDYFYIHFKETDAPGHDNMPLEKKKMIEFLDKEFFAKLKEIIEKNKAKLIVTGDHSTPCKLKSHSADPLPVLIYGNGKDSSKEFSEKESKKGSLGKIYGQQLLKKAGFA